MTSSKSRFKSNTNERSNENLWLTFTHCLNQIFLWKKFTKFCFTLLLCGNMWLSTTNPSKIQMFVVITAEIVKIQGVWILFQGTACCLFPYTELHHHAPRWLNALLCISKWPHLKPLIFRNVQHSFHMFMCCSTQEEEKGSNKHQLFKLTVNDTKN